MKIDKAYFTLAEVLERWRIPEADLIYLAENDRLRLSVRVYNVPVEFGDFEMTADGERFRAPWEQTHYTGLLDLYACDAFQLFRCSELYATEFRTPLAAYASVMHGAKPVFLLIGDLLLRREERDRFEGETGFSGAKVEPEPIGFVASRDYQHVRCRGREFHLGPIQAQVIRVLHEAALAGEPWKNGKTILATAGSKSLKMSDVFKSQPHWRELITSNGRGLYRIPTD